MAGTEVRFERTRDLELVKTLFTIPHIYRQTSDDFSEPPEKWEPPADDRITYVLVRDEKHLLGMFALVPENAICWKLHPCLLRNAWGEKAREIGRAFIQWVWEQTPCLRLIASIPVSAETAIKLALDSGLEEFGRNQKSIMKGGILEDQVLLGVSK